MRPVASFCDTAFEIPLDEEYGEQRVLLEESIIGVPCKFGSLFDGRSHFADTVVEILVRQN